MNQAPVILVSDRKAVIERYNAIGELKLREILPLQYYFGYSGVDCDNLKQLATRTERAMQAITKEYIIKPDDDDNLTTAALAFNLLSEHLSLIQNAERSVLRLLAEKQEGGAQ